MYASSSCSHNRTLFSTYHSSPHPPRPTPTPTNPHPLTHSPTHPRTRPHSYSPNYTYLILNESIYATTQYVQVDARVLPHEAIFFGGNYKYLCDNTASWNRDACRKRVISAVSFLEQCYYVFSRKILIPPLFT